MSDDQDSWLRIDERTDVIASLLVCLLCLEKASQEPMLWKQTIVSLHNALQGAMVRHLSGTAQMGALDNKSWRKTYEWHKRDRKGKIKFDVIHEDGLSVRQAKSAQDEFPSQRLADAKTLFLRLHDEVH